MAGPGQHNYRSRKPRHTNRSEEPGEDKKPKSNLDSDVLYIEANEEIGEVPLDAIDSFVIPGRDDKGQYSKLNFHLPPYLFRQAQICVRSNRFPYLEVADFVRHAMSRHVIFCARIRKSIPPSIVHIIEAMNELAKDNDIRIRAFEAYKEIERQITSCMQRGEVMEAVRLLNVVKGRLDGVPESPAVKELRERLQYQSDFVLGRDGSLKKRT